MYVVSDLPVCMLFLLYQYVCCFWYTTMYVVSALPVCMLFLIYQYVYCFCSPSMYIVSALPVCMLFLIYQYVCCFCSTSMYAVSALPVYMSMGPSSTQLYLQSSGITKSYCNKVATWLYLALNNYNLVELMQQTI